MEYHTPVLLDETLRLLDVTPDRIYVDCTLGHGGHSRAIIDRGGIVYGIDQDPQNLLLATSRISSPNFHPIHGNFSSLNQIISDNLPGQTIAGVLLDLGLNSSQQTAADRGFSFNDPYSLDMRLDPDSQDLTAEFIVNTYDYPSLVDIFSKISQESLSKPIAQGIIRSRQKNPIKTASQLAEIVRQTYAKYHHKSSHDPATKVFLALRVIVNQEFDNLKSLLNQTLDLPTGCRVVVITFHSGEDRIVKNFIRQHSIINLTPKPISPSPDEIRLNPLSRSSLLRSYKIS